MYFGVILGFLSFIPFQLSAQQIIFREDFDTCIVPSLPRGWQSSTRRTPGGDFTVIASSPHSSPNALITTNASIEQWILSPPILLNGASVDSVSFYVRRSSSHRATLLLEVLIDSNFTSPPLLTDTLTTENSTIYVRYAAQLPAESSQHPRLFFRWRTLGDGSGTSATLRIDDVAISARPKHDAALTDISHIPAFPAADEPVSISVTVTNVGTEAIRQARVSLHHDTDRDSVPSGNELFFTDTLRSTLAPSDTQSFSATIDSPSSLIIATVTSANDRHSDNDTIHHTIPVGVKSSSVIINELMFQPRYPEPEWIEILNTTEDSIDLSGWSVSDRNTSTRHSLGTVSRWIMPMQYLVLTRDSSLFLFRHPDAREVLSIPTLPLTFLNNDSDRVALQDHRGAIIDSTRYSSSWGGKNGRSLERISSSSSIDPTNWKTSLHPDSSSPGLKNSVSPKAFDAILTGVTFTPRFSSYEDRVTMHVTVRNAGSSPIEIRATSAYVDTDGDHEAREEELIATSPDPFRVEPGDSAIVSMEIPPLGIGTHRLIAKVEAVSDENVYNNFLESTLQVGYPQGTIVVNEVMFYPSAGEPEWIELYNTSGSVVDVRGWRIGNSRSATRYVLAESSLTMQPGSHAVVAKDSTVFDTLYPGLSVQLIQPPQLPSFFLHNNSDGLVLTDERGALMDSMGYVYDRREESGTSIERRDASISSAEARNWAMSQDSTGSTPGRRNDMARFDIDLAIAGLKSVYPDQRGTYVATAIVLNNGTTVVVDFALSLYIDENQDGRREESETRDERRAGPLSPNDSTTMNFEIDMLPSGRTELMYELDLLNDMRPRDNTKVDTVVSRFTSGSLVINEIMFDPATDGSEYLEFYNSSSRSVNVFGWRVSEISPHIDSAGKSGIRMEGIIVPSHSFLVLAADSHAFNSRHSAAGSPTLFTDGSSLGLSSSGEDIILIDLTGQVIDSIAYSPAWHNPEIPGTRGRSLERVSPSIYGNDSRTWSTSADPGGGTPGRVNSIFTVAIPPSAAIEFQPSPFSPDNDGFEDVTILSYSLPSVSSHVRVRIFDSMGRFIRTLSDGEPAGSSGFIIWNGLNDDGMKAPIGIYVAVLEALGPDGSHITAKGIVVLATRL